MPEIEKTLQRETSDPSETRVEIENLPGFGVACFGFFILAAAWAVFELCPAFIFRAAASPLPDVV